MNIEHELRERSQSNCELCGSHTELTVYKVPPEVPGNADHCVYICHTCEEQIQDPEKTDPNHWRCLNDSMWSQVSAVQVMAWRMLNRLKAEGWPVELLEMLYLDEQTLKWAKAEGESDEDEEIIKHVDSNGAILEAGDTVTLIKDLNVKGANFTAKRGTAVRRISLVPDNPEHIEGKIDGQHIVILTKFVKKSK